MHLVAGVLIIIVNFHEYTGCIGTFKAEQDKLALVTMLYCPNGEKYDYIAGVPVSSLEAYSGHNSRMRSWDKLDK